MDRDLRKLLQGIAEVRGSTEDVNASVREARKVASSICRGELKSIRREGGATMRAATSRARMRAGSSPSTDHDEAEEEIPF